MTNTMSLWRVMEMDSADAMSYCFCSICVTTQPAPDNIICCDTLMRQCETVADILDVKRAEPGYADLYRDIRDNGMRVPIYISLEYGRQTVCNGHHRIAIYEDLGYKEIPFTTSLMDGLINA